MQTDKFTQLKPSSPKPSEFLSEERPGKILGEAALWEMFGRGVAARLKRLEPAQSDSITRLVIEMAGREIDKEQGLDMEAAARIVNRVLRQEISKASGSQGRPDRWMSSPVAKAVRKLRRLTRDQRDALTQFYVDGVSVEKIRVMQPEDFLKLKASLRTEICPRRKLPLTSNDSQCGLGKSRKAS